MNKLNFLYISLILLLLVIAGCKKEPLIETGSCNIIADTVHPKSQVLQQVLDKYAAKGLPGAALLIRDQDGVWTGSAGFADLQKDIPMKSCHVSKVASITKPFIATLIMMLVEEGKISLSDKVDRFIDKKYAEKIENAGSATIKQLLNHTSGIYDVISDNSFYLAVLNNPEEKWSQEELLEYVYDKPAYFLPGDSAKYSNTNFLLLSMVLENVTGKTTTEFLHEKIIDPLQLTETYYDWHEKLPPYTTQGYFDLYNNGRIMNLSDYSTGNGNGYNGIYSTVSDLHIFIEALVRDRTLLTQSSLDNMLTFVDIVQTGKKFGLGIYKDFLDHPLNTYAYGHRGRDLAYSGDMFWFPDEDVTVVILVNYGTNAESELQEVYFDFRNDIVSELLK